MLVLLVSWFGCLAGIRVACVGNSVTFGYNLENRETNCYPAQLQQLLGSGYLVANFGVSGSTVLNKGHKPYQKTGEYQKALEFLPDMVVIELGLNDTDPRNWPNYGDEFIGDFQQLVRSFKTRDGQPPKVYICRMPPVFTGHPRFRSGTRDWFWQIQGSIAKVAENTGSVLVDLYSPLCKHPELSADNLHPDAKGAGIIAQTVYSWLTGDFGGFRLAPVFTENMVFQQKKPFHIYGMANSNDRIRVSLHTSSGETVTGTDGKWSIDLPPVEAGGPYTLQIRVNGKNVVDWNNIMVGEVWFCSGQSNMDFQLNGSKDADREIAIANDSGLRLFKYQGLVNTDDVTFDAATLQKINDLDFFRGSWQSCTSTTSADFSAVAYYFGKRLRARLRVPVGLIQMAVGGAPAEAFIDRKTLEFDPVLINEFNNWENNDFVFDWVRQRAIKNMGPDRLANQRHPYQPAYIFEAGLSTLGNFPVKGVVWYQGESNAHNYTIHEAAFSDLINSWRNFWDDQDKYFLFAQLTSINRPSWPAFRDSQRRLAERIKHTGMVVTTDLGDSLNVHPVRKMEVGNRFALQALQKVYGFQAKADGPLPSEAKARGEKLVVKFKNGKLKTSDGNPVRELEVQRGDGIFYPVSGCLKKNSIVIDHCSDAQSVRYAWEPFSRGNLINQFNIPASTFEIRVKSQE